MTYRLVFYPSVRDEIDEIYTWYEKEQPGLGEDFLAALNTVFNKLEAIPLVHQCVWETVRRAHTRRFPYSVYYFVEDDRVGIITVHHDKRDPEIWKDRFSRN